MFPYKKDKTEVVQYKKLKKILIHSYEKFDFYNRLMKEAKFDPYKFKSTEELEKLPVIDKESYRNFSNTVVKKNPELYKYYYKDSTSGSTGIPLEIYRTWKERAYMIAKYIRVLFLNGYKICDTTYNLPSPHRITEQDSFLQKFGIMRRYKLSYTESVEKMVNGFLQYKPDLLYGNKASIVQMALYIIENNITIEQPRLLLCGGEYLDKNSKLLIENVFGRNKLFEVYGAVEFNTLAYQLIGEKYYHFYHDTNILELDNNGLINKEKGNCIITDLEIYSFPLIRYKLGDWIETDVKDGVRVIKKVKGRLDDWVTFKNGEKLPFLNFYEVMDKHPEAVQFRFIQENYDLIIVQVVLEKRIDENKFDKFLLNDLKKEISDTISYKIEHMNNIPQDKTGKLRMIISKIK